MIRIDLLSHIATGKLRLDEAQAIVDEVLASPQAERVTELLGMTSLEWIAYGLGAPLEALARWRTTGWPTMCTRCGRLLRPERYAWAVEKRGHLTGLRHVSCPREPGANGR